MRIRAHYRAFYVRPFLALSLLAILALVGCGGGGGNSGNNGNGGGGNNTGFATITGTVLSRNDTAGPKAAPGVTITIVGTNPALTAVTGTDGSFSFLNNVPLSATRFAVTVPTSTNGVENGYYTTVQYNGVNYDTTTTTLPLSPNPLTSGSHILPDTIKIYGALNPNESGPPPPPTVP